MSSKNVSTPTIFLVGALLTSVFANYISSWFPPLYGMMLGGVIRDFFVLSFILVTLPCVLKLLAHKRYFYISLAALMLGFSIFVLLFISDSFNVALLGARNYLLYSMLIFFLMASKCFSQFNPKILSAALIFILFVISTIAIAEVYTNGYFLDFIGYKKDFADYASFDLVSGYLGRTRATAGIGDSLNFGYVVTLLTIYLLFHMPKSYFSYFFCSLILIAGSLAVIFSVTRGAIILLVIGYFLYFLKNFNIRTLICLVVILPCVYIFYGDSEYSNLIATKFSGDEMYAVQSSDTRVEMAKSSVEFIISEPGGAGLGSQGSGLKFSESDTRINTDNFFFIYLLELGLVGAMLMSIFYLLIFIEIIKYDMFNIYMLISFIFCGMLSGTLASPLYTMLYWLILVISNPESPRKFVRAY